MLDSILDRIRPLIPAPIFKFFSPPYHLTLAFLSALVTCFPSRRIKIIAVTGTKGKSSTTELIGAIFEEAGKKMAVSNTIRFKIGEDSEDNMYKMSMPGRSFMQRFIRRAVKAGCEYAVIEMTSQGAQLYRHACIDLDALVFTNLSPEHIESHGSYENYRAAKLSIAAGLSKSPKKNRTMIVNADDKESEHFLAFPVDKQMKYSLADVKPYDLGKSGIEFTLDGRRVHSPLSGEFNLYNILAAITTARSQGIPDDIIVRAVEKFSGIPGRVQRIEAGQDFTVVIDYAHTPDSLEKLYKVFSSDRNICVLGGTGGGRDTWKRTEMGRIADEYCAEIILTDEDPYDEDPRKIVEDVAGGIKDKKPTIIMDRRAAIREALKRAKSGDAVLITGKGTDPYIMGPRGTKTPWSDAKVAEEELQALKRNF